MNVEFQRIARRDKKAFLSDQCKEIEEKIEWERLEISSRKLEIPREHFMQDGLNKGKKASLNERCREIGKSNRTEKTRDLFKKIRDTKGTFHARWAQ